MDQRNQRPNWLFWFGLAVFAAGVSGVIGIRAWERTRTWSPVDMPVPLTVGHIRIPEFTVNIDARFDLHLSVNRQVPPVLMDKVLGIGDVTSPTDELSGFRMAWILSGDGKVLEKGISDGGNGQEAYWSSRVGRHFGYFQAEKGKKYRLELDVLDDGSQLAPYDPRLQVRVDVRALEEYLMGDGVMAMIAAAVAVLGFVVLLFAMVRRWRSERRRFVQSVS
jgi:hypothetical protein